jgi:hypothetical protein
MALEQDRPGLEQEEQVLAACGVAVSPRDDYVSN